MSTRRKLGRGRVKQASAAAAHDETAITPAAPVPANPVAEVKPPKGSNPKPRPKRVRKKSAAKKPAPVNLRISETLKEEVSNAIQAAEMAGDYGLGSPAEFYRAALRDYHESGQLTAQVETPDGQRDNRAHTSIRLSADERAIWDGIPRGKRADVLERAIRTRLKTVSRSKG